MQQAIDKFVIEGKCIKKEYHVGGVTTKVLNNISLQIKRGEFVSIMGPSGSGKSTLLYILGGLDTPTNGHVLLNGIDLSLYGDQEMSCFRRQKIGFVFQFYNLIPNLNVEENILLPLLLDGRKMRHYQDRLNWILQVVGLSDRRRHTPRELSGGQQQRVAIARALIGNPEIIFADEPTGNLDWQSGKEIMNLLQEINSINGQTIVMVTHSLEAAKCGTRVITVQDGALC